MHNNNAATVPADIGEAALRAVDIVRRRSNNAALNYNAAYWALCGVGMRDGVEAMFQYAETAVINTRKNETPSRAYA